MESQHDLETLVRSHVPLLAIETHEERRALELVERMAVSTAQAVFTWSVTEGLGRLGEGYESLPQTREPAQMLGHIKHSRFAGIYVLLDFHPYLDDPRHIRLTKEIALSYDECPRTLILISHELPLPPDLRNLSAQVRLKMPSERQIRALIAESAREWQQRQGRRVQAKPQVLERIAENLRGLPAPDIRRLARSVILEDGVLDEADIRRAQEAKYELLNRESHIAFEYELADMAEVGGLSQLKSWLQARKALLQGQGQAYRLDPPKGILLLGVQGGGKSLAAKATAGLLGYPLLRLDFARLYNKFHGETERNLHQALSLAEQMAPCVLWLDEIEKGISTAENDGGTSQRLLGTLLTWMAERKAMVFMVATANDIARLPPELMRKGRLDEIFFVDLPSPRVRGEIFEIHLRKRALDPRQFNLAQLAEASEGFSGAEIEQAIVAALYTALAQGVALNLDHLLAEIERTQPLSVVMAEQMQALRHWAEGRTVAADA